MKESQPAGKGRVGLADPLELEERVEPQKSGVRSLDSLDRTEKPLSVSECRDLDPLSSHNERPDQQGHRAEQSPSELRRRRENRELAVVQQYGTDVEYEAERREYDAQWLQAPQVAPKCILTISLEYKGV